jgi:hypothetical protein
MSYLTYRADMQKVWADFKKPGKKMGKAAVSISDPLKLFPHAIEFSAYAWVAIAKTIFFTGRKLFNR